jgi:hypothetical protein
LKRSILCVCLGAATASAAAQSASNDPFTAGSLYAACTHKVSDARTKEDIETLEQICNTYLHGLTDALFVMSHYRTEAKRRACQGISASQTARLKKFLRPTFAVDHRISPTRRAWSPRWRWSRLTNVRDRFNPANFPLARILPEFVLFSMYS